MSTGDHVIKGVDLSGKYAIITGCNAGLGKETVRCMVKAGATIIMACRNLEKANKAKDDIISTFDDTEKDAISKRLIIMQLDLSSLQSVYDFSKAFVKTGLKCDYLINNAGVMALPQYKTTADNIERQFGMFRSRNLQRSKANKLISICNSFYSDAVLILFVHVCAFLSCYSGVNHLGHFYLTKLLLDPVLIPNKTRIISLSSYGHKFAGSYENFDKVLTKAIEDGDFMGTQKHQYFGLNNYGYSKASNILFARELNTLYKDKGIISVSLHPGFIMETVKARNDLEQDMAFALQATLKFLPLYLLTPFFIVENKDIKGGVATTLRCVTMSDEEIIGGEFYYNCIPSSIEDRMNDNCKPRDDDDALAKKLWILSETILGNKGFKLKL